MTFETTMIFAFSLLLAWIKPGPGQAFIITRALNDGFLPALYIIFGIILSCQIFFLVAVLGFGVITQFFEAAGLYFKILGGGYLIYMGYSALGDLNSGLWKGRLDHAKRDGFAENFFPAMMITLANPISIFYFLSMMPALVPLGDLTVQDVIVGLGIIAAVGFMVDSIIALFVVQVKEALAETSFIRRINLFTSISFILIGGFFLYSAAFELFYK